jgi:hypothetical protein
MLVMLEPLDHEDEGILIFETSVTIYQSAQHNIPEDLNLQQHSCENLTLTLKFGICEKRVALGHLEVSGL